MKPLEIYSWQPPGWPQPHPCVVVSHPDRATRKDPVEVVVCSTQRATRQPKEHEFILDQADGLNWASLVKCDLIYAVPRSELSNPMGQVTEQRRGPLLRKVLAAHGWAEWI
jgi:mRNA-degrading endonuclease toxin of MazEF toxin-antitoxin module